MDYYNRKYIGFNLMESAKGREFALLPAFRLGQIRSLNELKSYLDLVNWDKRKLNAYVSCSKFKNIPNFSFDIKKRSKFTSVWFREEAKKELVGQNLFFDFDDSYKDENGKLIQKSFQEALVEAKIFKEYLDDYKIPYTFVFSGKKGFHLTINADYLKIENIDEMGQIHPHKEILENIKKTMNFKFLDLANNGTIARLQKLNYSLALPSKMDNPELFSESLMNVALPLTDEQISNFKIEEMRLINVLKTVKLIRRGNLERFSNLSLEQKRRNVQNFIKLFAFK